MRKPGVQRSSAVARAVLALVCGLAGCHRATVEVRERPRRTHDAGHAEHRVDASASASDASASDPIDASEPTPGSSWEPQPRWILTGDIENARDLGGVPLGTSETVRAGQLFRGPPLAQLTASGCSEFAELGIRTVIDLRIASERDLVPEAPCVQDSATIVAAPLPVPYSVSPADYVADLDAEASMNAILAQLADPEAYPIYFHCTWGRDRTGVVAAVVLKALGASRADILKEYLLSEPLVGAYPHSLEAVLDVIEQRGGIRAHLAGLGVPPSHLPALQAALTSPATED